MTDPKHVKEREIKEYKTLVIFEDHVSLKSSKQTIALWLNFFITITLI